MTVYLDHAATTPLRPEARDAWLSATEVVGNASSVHASGQAARRMLEEAREQISEVLGCDPIEVLFTSGGTESVNLALKGLWWSRADGTDAIVLPDGEHHATLDSAEWLVTSGGARVRPVALTPLGAVPVERFEDALPGAALATSLVANNEVGTVSDAAALSRAAAACGVPLHLDAVGAAGSVEVDFARWRGDARGGHGLVALSVSGHKVGAPVGTGALIVSRHATLTPLIHGGGQQRSLRSGTPDVPGARALAAALVAAERARAAEAARLSGLRDRLVTQVGAAAPDVELLGDPQSRLPGNVHLHFPGALGESLLFLFDQRGIAVSTGSACQAGLTESSHVVRALGRDEATSRSVIRVTMGRTTSPTDVQAFVEALPDVYARASRTARA